MKTNEFKTTPQRQIKTFDPVIPEGHNYKPVKRVIPEFGEDLKKSYNPFIGFMTSMVRAKGRVWI